MAKIGIIGSGWGARVQEPLFREAGLDVVGVARSTDWRRLLESDAEVISIVVPPSDHLEIATAVIEAGKHVINEKPTALNAAEARRLVALAQRHPNRIAMIDHELRFLPAWRAARERIEEIGPLRYIEVRYA